MSSEDQKTDPEAGNIDTKSTMAEFRRALAAPQKAIEKSLGSVEAQLQKASNAVTDAQSEARQIIENSDAEATLIVADAKTYRTATIEGAKKEAAEIQAAADREAASIFVLTPEATIVPEISRSSEPSLAEQPAAEPSSPAAEPSSPVAHEGTDLCKSCQRAMRPKPHLRAVIILGAIVAVGWPVLFFMLHNMSPQDAVILATVLTWVGAAIAIGSLIFLIIESDKSRPWSSRKDMGLKGWTSLVVSIIGIAISCAGVSLLQA